MSLLTARWAGSLVVVLALGACDDDSADCVVGDHELSVGETVADTSLGVICTCTVEGPGCSALETDGDPPVTLDAGPGMTDAAAQGDVVEPDAATPDGAPDAAGIELDAASAAPDAQRPDGPPPPPDAGPDMTPDAACGFGGDCPRSEAVCARWERRRTLRDSEWHGNVAACEAGDMTPEWRAAAVEYVNIYRYLAGLYPVESVARLDEKAQACALALNARGQITHALMEDEPCYTPAAAEAAARSNIHSRPAVGATPDYMSDFGEVNFAGLPHRLWMLSLRLGPIGIGSTNGFSCMYVAGGARRDDPTWVAWPPPGPFPVSASSADRTGWSVHSSRVNLGRAAVTVTVDGEERPVTLRHLRAEGGASHGIAFIPEGWRSEAGVTYHVLVEGAFGDGSPVPIEYDVEMIDCAR